MTYIGKSPDGTGVRSRFYYTQSSGGGTSVSGSSDDGTTLTFSDGAYVDVFLNGVLLVAGTDYNTTTANTIAGLAALANGDVVEVVVYDIFTVADTVSALNGGTFSNSVTIDKDGGTALTVDRATSDGNVAEFQQDGTTLAQIGALGVRGYFAADNAGISPYQNVIYPTNGTGTAVDNTVDIGHSSYRPKDLYLGGNLYIGGTASANALDDYEEGTWTPTIVRSSSNPSYTASYNHGTYVKIGRLVYYHFLIIVSAVSSQGSGNALVSGLPFNGSTSTSLYSQVGTIGYNDTWDAAVTRVYVQNSNQIQITPTGITQSNYGGTLSTGYFSAAGWYTT
jgi:hypothetical protein